ncbi:glucose-6-phosphate 1-epimerase [Nicoletella semolina]|uniref:Putative glucose-6-phosphate 1-epimerase n=1 Tax=Nicoletella semolina TaxID=271160 RepID=A0A4R2N7E6_9PAST|nr:D-hexose-6-phosphate mutarotase [Nicoletella semolina]MDH2924369.1 D-hexose-6-phosphate mutarotase [Nicoletella semolina]TCP16852.1 glucose-6-phosphate 1-epimerase [Nicoletella semolina]
MNYLEQLPPELNIIHYNDIPVLEISHPKVKAKISLQGAQLLSWQPAQSQQDVLWLSEVESFNAGNAIRGGVPICYPWFGGVKSPSHGYARIQQWALADYQVENEQIWLAFDFQDEARLEMVLGSTCGLTFTHLAQEPAQLALHTYFNVANIQQVSLEGLPTRCFNSLTKQEETVTSPRKITENVDCIYPITQPLTATIRDLGYQRHIQVEHLNATDVVVWNPWHKPTSGMSEQGYQTMVCVETARIHHLMTQGEQVSVKISLQQD